MVDKHAVFQGYYFFHHLGLDRDARDQYLGHPWYDRTAAFCHEYDQPAFDPSYDTLPLEHFEPAVRQLLASPRRSVYMRGSELPAHETLLLAQLLGLTPAQGISCRSQGGDAMLRVVTEETRTR